MATGEISAPQSFVARWLPARQRTRRLPRNHGQPTPPNPSRERRRTRWPRFGRDGMVARHPAERLRIPSAPVPHPRARAAAPGRVRARVSATGNEPAIDGQANGPYSPYPTAHVSRTTNRLTVPGVPASRTMGLAASTTRRATRRHASVVGSSESCSTSKDPAGAKSAGTMKVTAIASIRPPGRSGETTIENGRVASPVVWRPSPARASKSVSWQRTGYAPCNASYQARAGSVIGRSPSLMTGSWKRPFASMLTRVQTSMSSRRRWDVTTMEAPSLRHSISRMHNQRDASGSRLSHGSSRTMRSSRACCRTALNPACWRSPGDDLPSTFVGAAREL